MYRYLHLDFGVYVADMATDVMCLLLYMLEHNWPFAVLQLILIAATVRRQLKIAKPKEGVGCLPCIPVPGLLHGSVC